MVSQWLIWKYDHSIMAALEREITSIYVYAWNRMVASEREIHLFESMRETAWPRWNARLSVWKYAWSRMAAWIARYYVQSVRGIAWSRWNVRLKSFESMCGTAWLR